MRETNYNRQKGLRQLSKQAQKQAPSLKTQNSIVFAGMESLTKTRQWCNAKLSVKNGITFNASALKNIRPNKMLAMSAWDAVLFMTSNHWEHSIGTTIVK